MIIELTEKQASILLYLINESNWKGEGVEIAQELKKILTPKENPKEERK
jgi:hypothetical protein